MITSLDQGADPLLKPTAMKRLLWLDIAKAIAISWVVYFHFFNTVFEHTQFPADDWSSLAAGTVTVIRMAWLKISGIGFHAVGVFIILSGWALVFSGFTRCIGWRTWFILSLHSSPDSSR
jgi:peptidoglycan/LPS O-acetylase OafA/YrhL